jgi:hypothetical protein
MASVFISYTQRDREHARRIAQALAANAIAVWLDQDEILPGDELRSKIEQGIRTSEYFLVLLSRSSLASGWVTRELEFALEHNADAARQRIIPALVESVELPPRLAEFRYIDLSHEYEEGVAEIIRTVRRGEARGAPPLGEIIDVEGVVRNSQEAEREYRGAAYGVTTILSILTMVVTLATAIPAFYQAFLQRSKVYFAVTEERLTLPAHIDRSKVASLLVQNGIPSGYVRVQVLNRGTTSAKKVSGSVVVSGRIVDFNTVPPDKPRPVWVGIEKEADLAKYPSTVRLELADLVPERILTSNVTYHQDGDGKQPPRVEFVADGELATQVATIEAAPKLTFWSYFEAPAKVLGIGLFITLLAGFVTVARRNREVSKALLLLVKELSPTLSYIVSRLRALL